MHVTGVDACPAGWVAVTLRKPGGPAEVRACGSLAGLLADLLAGGGPAVVGIDMPLGLLEVGLARGGPRGARPARPAAQLGLCHRAAGGMGASRATRPRTCAAAS